MPRVYIETTIPSYYFETRRTPRMITWREATREWWEAHRHAYELVTSETVLEEISEAPATKREQMLQLVTGLPRLQKVSGLEETVEYYLEHRLMPAAATPDAFHLALASLHNIDFLLTWNIRHLANANKTRHLQVLNGRLGLPVPIITTPELLTPEANG